MVQIVIGVDDATFTQKPNVTVLIILKINVCYNLGLA